MAGGVNVDGARVPAGTTCITCGYSLEGLTREGVCPECGTPIRNSLRPSELGFMQKNDARRLSRASSRLWSTLWIVVANVGLLIIVVFTNGTVFGMYAPCGAISMLVAGVLWLLAWHDVASVREAGAGSGAATSKGLLFVVAWGQTLFVLAFPMSFALDLRGHYAAYGAGLMGCLLFLGLALLAGQWRFLTLFRRAGDTALAKGAREAMTLVTAALSLGVVSAVTSAAFDPGAGLALGCLAGLVGLVAAARWGAFIRDLHFVAADRAGEAEPRAAAAVLGEDGGEKY